MALQTILPELISRARTETDCDSASSRYLSELGMDIVPAPQRIQFTTNFVEPIHRWASYIQGFSARFVLTKLQKYIHEYIGPVRTHDPFAGCGTVLVEAKKSGIWSSSGTELNPLMAFITDLKLNSWSVDPEQLWSDYERLRFDTAAAYPTFLDTERQFKPAVLHNLCLILGSIEKVKHKRHSDLLRMAFASILTDCSNLKRSPCLGYDKKKYVHHDQPNKLFRSKVQEICEDLRLIQRAFPSSIKNESMVVEKNAKDFTPQAINIALTSPPYMNGMDYVMNYKIEMAWLGFMDNHTVGKELKNEMIACDNISKAISRGFAEQKGIYSEPWLIEIIDQLTENIRNWGPENKLKRIQRARIGAPTSGYRRDDMPQIVHKYFDDMNQVMARMSTALVPNGRFILVVGDSFIADTYIPTDLLLAKMGLEHGLEVESIERARNRRSGQVRSFRLRETIVTLRKPH